MWKFLRPYVPYLVVFAALFLFSEPSFAQWEEPTEGVDFLRWILTWGVLFLMVAALIGVVAYGLSQQNIGMVVTGVVVVLLVGGLFAAIYPIALRYSQAASGSI